LDLCRSWIGVRSSRIWPREIVFSNFLGLSPESGSGFGWACAA
jgi:hypothetical protein